MKKIVKKEFMLKGAGVLLIVTVLLFSNLSVAANTTINKSKQNLQPITPLYMQKGWKTILDEDFEGAEFPPENWTLIRYNTNETWDLNCTHYHWDPCSAYCRVDEEPGWQNEKLITKSLNFAGYTKIRFQFWWIMEPYYALEEDSYDLNISISIDNGTTWKLIWTEDYLPDFNPFFWTPTNITEDYLDLSEYIGETNVKICFQYIGLDAADCGIDDIIVEGNKYVSNPLLCDAGGDYEGWAGYALEFNGTASGGAGSYTWKWDFGDNTTNSTGKDPIHEYNLEGTYTVRLKVQDRDGNVANASATVKIYKPPKHPPKLEIRHVWGTIGGLRVLVKNMGGSNANFSDVEYKIVIKGGILPDKTKVETIATCEPGFEKWFPIYFLLRFGIINIRISVKTYGSEHIISAKATKIGPFVFNIVYI